MLILASEDASKIEDVIAAISQKSQGVALLVVGNFNANLVAPEVRAKDGEIASAISALGLEYLSGNFLPCHKPWLRDGRMWCMRCRGREVRSRTDYILGTYRYLLQNLAVRDAWHNTDHCLVLGCLCGDKPTGQLSYLGKQTGFSINPTRYIPLKHLLWIQ